MQLDQAERLRRIEALAAPFHERAPALDRDAAFPAENFADLRAAGLLALTVPAEHGGGDLWWGSRFREFYELIEALARIDGPTAQLLQVHSHAAGILSRLSTPAQRDRLLPDIVREGRLLASVGSEAKPSGRLADISRTELEPDGRGGWRLTCDKHFASLAPGADELLVWTAVPGAGPYQERSVLVLVPRGAPEVELIDTWDVLGMRATVSWSVRITGYAVPEERLIGEPGAWARDPRTFTLAFAANHLGTAAGALDFVVEWVRARPDAASSELVRVALGEMSAQLSVGRAALYAAAALWEAGRHDEAELESTRVLHHAKRSALDVVGRAFDVCGARAAFATHPLERIYRDVRTFTLHFRDDQAMAQVGRSMLDGRFRAKGHAGASTFPAARA